MVLYAGWIPFSKLKAWVVHYLTQSYRHWVESALSMYITWQRLIGIGLSAQFYWFFFLSFPYAFTWLSTKKWAEAFAHSFLSRFFLMLISPDSISFYFLYIHYLICSKVTILLYFIGPKHSSGNCYVNCFLIWQNSFGSSDPFLTKPANHPCSQWPIGIVMLHFFSS